jgi:molybdate transport system substrate-binding protein
MSGRDRPGDLAQFAAAPFDAITDLCGDPVTAGLRALFAGNQYMVLPEFFGSFLDASPGAGPVFYETLPPGIVVAQLRRGGLRMGCLELRFTPDLIAASPRALGELHRDGLVGRPRSYASNVLSLLVRSGNPARVRGLADLAAPGLRVALPDPETEGIGRLALRALTAAGGNQLRDEVFDVKRRAGETVLTGIHHRQSPAWLADGSADAAVVWETEARHHLAIGTPVEAVPIDPAANQAGEYAAAVVNGCPHPQLAEQLLDYLTGPAGQAIYARYGFTRSRLPEG